MRVERISSGGTKSCADALESSGILVSSPGDCNAELSIRRSSAHGVCTARTEPFPVRILQDTGKSATAYFRRIVVAMRSVIALMSAPSRRSDVFPV